LDYKNAAIEFEKALELNPLDYSNFENAATANYMVGNVEKALEQINIVINELNPLNGKCEYIKALIFIRMGDPIGACPLLATSRDSGHSPALGTYDQYCRSIYELTLIFDRLIKANIKKSLKIVLFFTLYQVLLVLVKVF
jgi:tetratricopeptide (TPR) repeat protein